MGVFASEREAVYSWAGSFFHGKKISPGKTHPKCLPCSSHCKHLCVAVLKSRDSTKFSCVDKGDSILTWVGAAGYSPSSGRACNPWPETARLDQPVLSKPEREENLMEREGPSNYSLFSLIILAASPSPYLHPWHQSSN